MPQDETVALKQKIIQHKMVLFVTAIIIHLHSDFQGEEGLSEDIDWFQIYMFVSGYCMNWMFDQWN